MNKVLACGIAAALAAYAGLVALLLNVRMSIELTALVAALIGPTVFVLGTFPVWIPFFVIMGFVVVVAIVGIRAREPAALGPAGLAWVLSGFLAFLSRQ